MIKAHSFFINKHKAFKAAVIDMSHPAHLQHLLELNITVEELLLQLVKWQTDGFPVSIDGVSFIYVCLGNKSSDRNPQC